MGKSDTNQKWPLKMRLVHPPGHIFWKKEPQIDRLSLFIERVVNGGKIEKSDNPEDTKEKGCEVNKSEIDEIEEVQKAQDTNDDDGVEQATSHHDEDKDRSSKQQDDDEYEHEENESVTSNRPNQTEDKVDTEEQGKLNCEKAQRVIERLYSTLFTEDLMFIRVFDLPPKNLCSENGLYFRQISEKQFECRVFLKRFMDQNACQLLFGAGSDIPPGMAVYKLNDNFTNEQKLFTKEALGPCMDGEGFMSPGKMYPWFAMGIAKAVRDILEEECNDSQSNVSKNDERSDFEGIEVAGEFPVIKLILPVEDEDQEKQDSKQKETPQSYGEDINLNHSDTQSNHSGHNTNKEQNNTDKEQHSDKQPTDVKPNHKQAKAQRYPKSSAENTNTEAKSPTNGMTSTPRSQATTPRSNTYHKQHSDKTFASHTSAAAEDEEITEDPIVITIKPAIKGYGLPKSIKLQHALPLQKPYCDKGKKCIKDIFNKIEDGQSMWYLEASTINMNQNIEKSARFRSTFRKIGKVTKFWNISFDPITEMIEKNMQEEYEKHEFSIDLKQVKSMVHIIRAHHGWKCISDQYIDVAIMNVVKSNMLTMRSVGECTRKVLGYLQSVVQSRSCPSFLQPNVNIAQGMDEKEAEWVASEMKQVLTDIDNDAGAVLIYIGYKRKNNLDNSELN